VFSGNLPEIRRLAASKAIVNAANSDGVTPLMIAAGLGNVDAIGALLSASADVNATTLKDKTTALMFAADFGHLQVVQLLAEGGARVKDVDANKLSAIDYAVTTNKGATAEDRERTVAVGKYLQSKGAVLENKGGVGLLFAVISEPDIKGLLDKARAEK